MAVTKIHGIKATVDKAIEYICNPDKTDEQIYVSSFACSPETAALDFKYTLDHTNEQISSDGQNRENKAFHLIQAFAPGEVSYEEAHTIGKELADQLLEGKYSYVLTTDIDKGHMEKGTRSFAGLIAIFPTCSSALGKRESCSYTETPPASLIGVSSPGMKKSGSSSLSDSFIS